MKLHRFFFGAGFLILIFLNGAAQASNAIETSGTPPGLQFSISVPDVLQSHVLRQDYENQSIFNFQASKGNPAFLFSLTRVTTDQWLQIKGQMEGVTILSNEDGYMTFLQKTHETRIKGEANEQYQKVLAQLDAMIASIEFD